MMDLCMSQTSQQQQKPHTKNCTAPPPFSACLTFQLPVSKSLDVLQHCSSWSAASQQSSKSHQNFMGCSRTSAQAFMSVLWLRTYACIQETHPQFPLPQRAVPSCCSSHSLVSQVFQLFTMQAHCDWKNLKRNIELIVLSSSVSLSNSLHTLQTL